MKSIFLPAQLFHVSLGENRHMINLYLAETESKHAANFQTSNLKLKAMHENRGYWEQRLAALPPIPQQEKLEPLPLEEPTPEKEVLPARPREYTESSRPLASASSVLRTLQAARQ